jgi:hypothetical protein
LSIQITLIDPSGPVAISGLIARLPSTLIRLPTVAPGFEIKLVAPSSVSAAVADPENNAKLAAVTAR